MADFEKGCVEHSSQPSVGGHYYVLDREQGIPQKVITAIIGKKNKRLACNDGKRRPLTW